jgi:hypothetical protein
VKAVRKKKGVYPSYGLRRGSPWPSRGKKKKGDCCERGDGVASFLVFQQKNVRVLHATGAMIGCTRPGTPHAKTECPVVHSKRRGVRRSFGPSGHGAKTKIETAREGDAAVLKRPLRFGMRRRVVWTRPERGREPSRVTLSTRPPPGGPEANQAGAPTPPLRCAPGGHPKHTKCPFRP